MKAEHDVDIVTIAQPPDAPDRAIQFLAVTGRGRKVMDATYLAAEQGSPAERKMWKHIQKADALVAQLAPCEFDSLYAQHMHGAA